MKTPKIEELINSEEFFLQLQPLIKETRRLAKAHRKKLEQQREEKKRSLKSAPENSPR